MNQPGKVKAAKVARASKPETTTTLDLKLSTLTVVKKADILRDEPMLWTMFIVLSLDTINSRQFVVTNDPLAGKLAKAGKGDAVSIPASVGHFHNQNGGIGLIGVAALAFDNDLRTKKQIKDGYAAGAKALNDAIIAHFPEFGFDPVGEQEQKEIQEKMKTAIKEAFLEHGFLLTVFGGKPLGGATFSKTLIENNIDEKVTLTFEAKKERAIYRVDGSLKFTRLSA